MHETSKAVMRRLHDIRFATRYFVGDGIDIGSGPDPLSQYAEQLPLMRSCRDWDLKDGDAQILASLGRRIARLRALKPLSGAYARPPPGAAKLASRAETRADI
jgi:hypothetical protein